MDANLLSEGCLGGAREKLEACETKIADNLDTPTRRLLVAEALNEIHHKKLYREAGLETFEAYVKTRWSMSRSRAYQIMRFVKEVRAATLSGRPIPENERQSRNVRNQANGEVSFEKRWTSVFKFLNQTFLDCPEHERDRFVRTLEVTTRSFAHRVQQSGKE